MGGFENNPSPQKHLLHHSLIFILIFTGNAMYRTTKADFEIPSLRSCSSSLVFFFTERRRLSVPVRITTTHHCVHSNISPHPIYIYISHFWLLTRIFLLSLLGVSSPALTISEMIVVETQDNAILLNPIFILLFSFPFFSGKCSIC